MAHSTDDQRQATQAPGLVQSAKEVLGGEEQREDKDELTSTDFSNAATGLQASEAAGAAKQKILPTAQAAGPKEGDASEEVSSAAQEAKDTISSGANYVASRFTAPADGDKNTDVGKEAKEKGEDVRKEAKEKTEDASQSVSAGVQDVKDRITGGAQYIADRFTADPAGQGSVEKPKPATEGKSGGILSGWLPESNKGDPAKAGDGKSYGDKAQEQYNSLKEEASKTQDTIADKITPHTQEEADISAGLIPSTTAREQSK